MCQLGCLNTTKHFPWPALNWCCMDVCFNGCNFLKRTPLCNGHFSLEWNWQISSHTSFTDGHFFCTNDPLQRDSTVQHFQIAKLQKKQCRGVYFWLYGIAYWMPIQQKLPPPVLLFSDFADWVTVISTNLLDFYRKNSCLRMFLDDCPIYSVHTDTMRVKIHYKLVIAL